MKLRKNQAGFSAVELFLILVIVGALAFIGYAVYHRQKSAVDTSSGSANSQSSAKDVSSAPAVSTTSGLDKAATTIDQNDPATANTSDSSQLDSQTNTF